MIVEQSKQIVAEVGKAFIGKNEIVEKVLMTIYAGGCVIMAFPLFSRIAMPFISSSRISPST